MDDRGLGWADLLYVATLGAVLVAALTLTVALVVGMLP